MSSTDPVDSAAASAASVYAALVGFLSGQRWIFREEPARNLVAFEYASAAGAWTTYAAAFEEARQVAVYGVVPFPIEPAHRLAVAELITRLNFGLVIGNFEIDLDDGEVRYKTSLDFEGAALDQALLLQLVRANLAMMEHHLAAFVAVAAGNVSVADALAAVEPSYPA